MERFREKDRNSVIRDIALLGIESFEASNAGVVHYTKQLVEETLASFIVDINNKPYHKHTIRPGGNDGIQNDQNAQLQNSTSFVNPQIEYSAMGDRPIDLTQNTTTQNLDMPIFNTQIPSQKVLPVDNSMNNRPPIPSMGTSSHISPMTQHEYLNKMQQLEYMNKLQQMYNAQRPMPDQFSLANRYNQHMLQSMHNNFMSGEPQQNMNQNMLNGQAEPKMINDVNNVPAIPLQQSVVTANVQQQQPEPVSTEPPKIRSKSPSKWRQGDDSELAIRDPAVQQINK